MKKTHLLLLLAIIVAPFIVTAAVNKIATLPPYDGVADVGKTPTIKADGSGLQWSVASGVSGSTGYALASTGAVVNNDLVSWSGTDRRQLKDSGIPSANVVLVSRAVNAGNGLAVTNSGLLSSDITMSIVAPVSVLNGGTSGITAASGFANLSPQTTKGDLIGFSTVPLRLPVGTTGQILQTDSASAAGVSWTTDKRGVETASNAAAGNVGESLIAGRTTSTGCIALTSNTDANVAITPGTSITLTAGDWDVRGGVLYNPGASTVTSSIEYGISKTSATLPSAYGVPNLGEIRLVQAQAALFTGGSLPTYEIPTYRVLVSSSTPLYLVARATFTTSTNAVCGYIEARRVR